MTCWHQRFKKTSRLSPCNLQRTYLDHVPVAQGRIGNEAAGDAVESERVRRERRRRHRVDVVGRQGAESAHRTCKNFPNRRRKPVLELRCFSQLPDMSTEHDACPRVEFGDDTFVQHGSLGDLVVLGLQVSVQLEARRVFTHGNLQSLQIGPRVVFIRKGVHWERMPCAVPLL